MNLGPLPSKPSDVHHAAAPSNPSVRLRPADDQPAPPVRDELVRVATDFDEDVQGLMRGNPAIAIKQNAYSEIKNMIKNNWDADTAKIDYRFHDRDGITTIGTYFNPTTNKTSLCLLVHWNIKNNEGGDEQKRISTIYTTVELLTAKEGEAVDHKKLADAKHEALLVARMRCYAIKTALDPTHVTEQEHTRYANIMRQSSDATYVSFDRSSNIPKITFIGSNFERDSGKIPWDNQNVTMRVDDLIQRKLPPHSPTIPWEQQTYSEKVALHPKFLERNQAVARAEMVIDYSTEIRPISQVPDQEKRDYAAYLHDKIDQKQQNYEKLLEEFQKAAGIKATWLRGLHSDYLDACRKYQEIEEVKPEELKRQLQEIQQIISNRPEDIEQSLSQAKGQLTSNLKKVVNDSDTLVDEIVQTSRTLAAHFGRISDQTREKLLKKQNELEKKFNKAIEKVQEKQIDFLAWEQQTAPTLTKPQEQMKQLDYEIHELLFRFDGPHEAQRMELRLAFDQMRDPRIKQIQETYSKYGLVAPTLALELPEVEEQRELSIHLPPPEEADEPAARLAPDVSSESDQAEEDS